MCAVNFATYWGHRQKNSQGKKLKTRTYLTFSNAVQKEFCTHSSLQFLTTPSLLSNRSGPTSVLVETQVLRSYTTILLFSRSPPTDVTKTGRSRRETSQLRLPLKSRHLLKTTSFAVFTTIFKNKAMSLRRSFAQCVLCVRAFMRPKCVGIRKRACVVMGRS